MDLAAELLASVDGPADPAWEQAWQVKLDWRAADTNRSRTTGRVVRGSCRRPLQVGNSVTWIVRVVADAEAEFEAHAGLRTEFDAAIDEAIYAKDPSSLAERDTKRVFDLVSEVMQQDADRFDRRQGRRGARRYAGSMSVTSISMNCPSYGCGTFVPLIETGWRLASTFLTSPASTGSALSVTVAPVVTLIVSL